MPPTWVHDAVFYQIFPDRFARSDQVAKPANLEPWDDPPTPHGFKGGDLLGVVERLDYLQDLGITALYFNPIFQSAANHRYHTHDYYRVDPILGGDAAFRQLLEAAHERGMRVMLDGVFNHASRGFYQFHHLLENGPQSPYIDWFIVDDFPLNAYAQGAGPNYEAWAGLPALPKFNTDHPPVQDFLLGVAEHWTRVGIDGWRLDVPLDIRTPDFWPTFRRRVRAINPQAYLLAEIWEEAASWVGEEGPFDAVMNYVFNRACLGFFGGEALDTSRRPGGFPLEVLDGRAFAEAIDELLGAYPWETTLAQFNLLGSHDMSRFLTLVGGEGRRLQLAVLFQMTFPGVPCIYYGDEIGMMGGPDPDCRRAFPWDRSRWNRRLRAWYQRCIALRHAHPALRRGAFRQLYAGETVYAFARWLENDDEDGPETLLIALNAGSEVAQIALPVGEMIDDGGVLRGLLSDQEWSVEEGAVQMELAPFGGHVLEIRL